MADELAGDSEVLKATVTQVRKVGKDLARLIAYCGYRYYWVATKTCVVRAISKDVLAKAGFISCLDYYNERHALKLC